jgi:hypothetical protein
VFDESSSVSDDLLALYKSMVSQLCEENKDFTLLSFSMTNSIDSIVPQVITKENVNEIFRRNLGGGTGDFVQALTRFDEIIEKHGEKIVSELKNAKNINISLDELKKIYDEGGLSLVVFTDGYTNESVDRKGLKKLKEIKAKKGINPILYVLPEGRKDVVEFYPRELKDYVDFYEIEKFLLDTLGIDY